MENPELLTAILIVALLALAALGVALLAFSFKRLRDGEDVPPWVKDQVLPWVYQAIFGAYRVSEWSIDELQERMRGADKAMIARSIYPAISRKVIRVGAIMIPVGSVISEAQFVTWVQAVFDGMDRMFQDLEDTYKEAFQKWADENKPPHPG